MTVTIKFKLNGYNRILPKQIRKLSATLSDFQDGRFQYTELVGILREFRPANNFSPIVCVCFLLSGTGKHANLIVSESPEDHEYSGEYTRLKGHCNIDCGGNFTRRQKPIGNVLVCRKGRYIIAEKLLASASQLYGLTYLIKAVRA